MFTILVRTIIIYVLLMLIMRLMGKRQLGEIDMSELVTTFLLSEIAALPITNSEIPILFSIIPISLIAVFEITLSALIIKCPKLKKVLTSGPSVIISKGKMNIKEMEKVRLSLDELVSQVRQNGIYDLSEVDYAILEENGKMSIIPRSACRPATKKDLSIVDSDSGSMHIIICDGRKKEENLSLVGKDDLWLKNTLIALSLKQKDIFCMTVNDCGDIFIEKKDGTVIQPSASQG